MSQYFQNVLLDFFSVSETISVDQTVTQVFRLRPYQDVYVNVVDPKVCLCSALEFLLHVIRTLPQDEVSKEIVNYLGRV